MKLKPATELNWDQLTDEHGRITDPDLRLFVKWGGDGFIPLARQINGKIALIRYGVVTHAFVSQLFVKDDSEPEEREPATASEGNK